MNRGDHQQLMVGRPKRRQAKQVTENVVSSFSETTENRPGRNSLPNILAINPGSTSTKLAMFRGWDEIWTFEMKWNLPSGLRGPAMEEEVQKYVGRIQGLLSEAKLVPGAIVGRGGFIDCRRHKLTAGVYQVAAMRNGRSSICRELYRTVVDTPELDHAANYGIPAAAQIAIHYNIPAFTVDPIVVDDFQEVARLSGYASIERRSVAHVLSVRAMGRKAAARLGMDFLQARMVAVHMGGGITVAAVREGKLVDVNNALLGGGPFSPQRVGSLPMRDLIEMCYSGRFTKEELKKELTKRGGLISYLGDDNFQRIEARIAADDQHANLIVHGLAYQVAKEIGAMAVAAGLPIDAIAFSGGLSHSALLLGRVRALVGHMAPVFVYPGSLEMEAMAHGICRVLTGKETALTYSLN
jgi:butyrate kinase